MGREVACLGWRLDPTAGMPAQRVAPAGLSYGLMAALLWFRPTAGTSYRMTRRQTASSASLRSCATSPPMPTRPPNTSPAHLQLPGSPWPWRATTLFALTIAAAIGVALVHPAAVRRHRP